MQASIGVVIIAKNPKSSSVARLANDIRKYISQDIHILPAVTPDSEFWQNGEFGLVNSFQLSRVEQAISVSHHEARRFSLLQNWAWSLILEEDAVLFEDPHLLRKTIDFFCSSRFESRPTALHLFPEQNGVLLKFRNLEFYRVAWLPDYAVGYILSQAAIKLSVAQFDKSKLQVADWPTFMRKLEWWAPASSLIIHPIVSEEVSATQKVRMLNQSKMRLVNKISDPGYWVGFILQISNKVCRHYGNHPILSESLRSVALSLPLKRRKKH